MNLRHLRVLPFPFWGLWNFFGGDPDDDILGKDKVRIPAVIGKPGWYYDRDSRVSWYECPNGRAYIASEKDFLYQLRSLNDQERPLSSQEREAIKLLLDFGNSGIARQLSDRLYRDDCRRMLRRAVTEAKKCRLDILGR